MRTGMSFFFSSRRRHTRCSRDWSSDVCSSDLIGEGVGLFFVGILNSGLPSAARWKECGWKILLREAQRQVRQDGMHFEQSMRSEEHTSELQSRLHLVCRLLLEKKKTHTTRRAAVPRLLAPGCTPACGQ